MHLLSQWKPWVCKLWVLVHFPTWLRAFYLRFTTFPHFSKSPKPSLFIHSLVDATQANLKGKEDFCIDGSNNNSSFHMCMVVRLITLLPRPLRRLRWSKSQIQTHQILGFTCCRNRRRIHLQLVRRKTTEIINSIAKLFTS